MVAKANVMIAFFNIFAHCHFRDVKIVRKNKNSRNLSVLLKMVRNI